jgi:hypothetical protein
VTEAAIQEFQGDFRKIFLKLQLGSTDLLVNAALPAKPIALQMCPQEVCC